MNYFAHDAAARRYATNRPYFHPLVIERIRRVLNLLAPVNHALDVACGTGQSALALKEIADRVTATDIAPEMLAQAPPEPGIDYVVARAEELPFDAERFDLATVSLAFHWFERERFLHEARRVLKSGAWLVIYNNGFCGKMRENEAFGAWNSAYLARYPSPPRNHQEFTDADAARGGFHFARREGFVNEVPFSPEQLVGYLSTQSNIIASVEQGRESLRDVEAWLAQSLAPLFPAPVCHFRFEGFIWFLQKPNNS